MTASAQAQRILAATARRGGSIIREAAYASLVVRIAEGSPSAPEALELFRARHRFTPGWSSRTMVDGRMAPAWDAPTAAQDGPGAAANAHAALGLDAPGWAR